MDEPNIAILDRDQTTTEVADHFESALDLLVEVVNYSTNLIIRTTRSAPGEIKDAIAVATLGKHVFAMLDSIEQLTRAGSGMAAQVVLRSMLESSWSLEWILQSNSDFRARCYYVANLRSERDWQSCGIPGTDQHDSYRRSMGEFYQDPLRGDAVRIQQAQDRVDDIERRLATAGFVQIDANFTSQRGQRPYDSRWYQVAGAQSIRAIAKDLHRTGEYDVMYKINSGAAHASRYHGHFRVAEEGRLVLLPIRSMESLSQTISFAATLAIRTCRSLLSEYRADELLAFNQMYVREWRERAASVPMIEVEFEALPSF